MVDARGVEIPYVDRDGKELKTVLERYMPAKGQKFFLKGGVIDNPKYEYRGPETLDFEELMKRGYKLPFYADLSRMPDEERRVIWGMMVGEEGKTKIPILENYTRRGFDFSKHMLQSYGTGWQSANFLKQERQLFGAPGGIMHDWDLKTNIEGIYAAGELELVEYDKEQVEEEVERLYAPLYVDADEGMNWKELNMAISKAMQNYCGGVKCDALLKEGLDLLDTYKKEFVPKLYCTNPHDLMRTHEVLDILTVAELILQACLLRRENSETLCFARTDTDAVEEKGKGKHIVLRQENGRIISREVPLDFFGDLKTEYEKRNADYIASGEVPTHEA